MFKKYLILFFLFILSTVVVADGYLRFTHLSSDEGLSQNTIYDIYKDSRGFMWFGTRDGLNRFDGKKFTVYRQSHDGTNSIGANSITGIAEDSENHLWIGTKQNGISIYFPEIDSFTVLSHHSNNPYSIAGNYISGIRFIKPHTMLVGFANERIDIINTRTLEIKHVSLLEQNSVKTSINRISFVKDQRGNIWIGSAINGLFLYDTVTGTAKKIPLFAAQLKGDNQKKVPVGITDIKMLDKNHIIMSTHRTGVISLNINNHEIKQFFINQNYGKIGNNNIINSFEIINDSILWVTTMDNGLVEYNIRSDEKTYYNTTTSNNNFDFNGFLSIYKDNQGIIWLGSNGMGLYYYNPQSSMFITASNLNTHKPTLHIKSVRTIYKIKNHLYVGGYTGFNEINLTTNNCTKLFDNGFPFYLAELPDDPGYLWLAMEGRTYLIRYHIKSRKTERIYPFSSDSAINWLPYYKFLPYRDSLIWLGSIRGNLFLYNYKSKKLVSVFSPEKIPDFLHGNILTLHLRNNHELWAGSMTDGIVVINPESGKILNRFTDRDSGSCLYYVNAVKTIVEDHHGNIWVGTGNGLYQYIDSTATFKGYFTSDGLPNNTIYGILEDAKGNLWLSTNKGISRFDPRQELFVNFDKKYGLQDNEFNTNAYFKDSTGFFCFGGIKGITWFYPEKFRMDTINTKLQITGISVNNIPVKASVIHSKKPIVISRGTHALKISYAGLDYINPFGINYRYKINDESWVNLGNENTITLGLSDYGTSTLTINASNTVGHWSKYNTKLQFYLPKPFYFQIWFTVLLILFIILLGTTYYYYRTLVLRKRQQLLVQEIKLATTDLLKTKTRLEKEIIHKEKVEQELRESNATKSKVFSIIGHDLINPFNALLGFSELLKENIDVASIDELKSYANVMYHSSHTLFEMVQNILNWSRAQQNKIVSFPEMININSLAQLVLDSQSQHASSKNIRLQNSVPKSLEAYFDRNMLEIIFRNLISNAIKFSYKNTTVEISAKSYHKKVIVEIRDEGIGMEKAKLDNLFNPNQDIRTKGTRDEKGTGLGLLLVKEFMDRNKASIHVESKEGHGTRFTLILKTGEYNGTS